MATNDFVPFAASGGANVETQAAYIADSTILANGFSSGIASSLKLNKVWRQSSIISAIVGQFIADMSGANSIDDGTTATLLNNFKKLIGGRTLPHTWANNDYIMLPGGVILQWGFTAVNGTANAVTTITFPIAFPNALLRAMVTYASTGSSGYSYASGGTTTTLGTQCSVTSGFNGWYALGY